MGRSKSRSEPCVQTAGSTRLGSGEAVSWGSSASEALGMLPAACPCYCSVAMAQVLLMQPAAEY